MRRMSSAVRVCAALAVAIALAGALASCTGGDDDAGAAGSDDATGFFAYTVALGPGEAKFEAADGVTLRGRHYGDGDVTVVLAHMLPADQESWAPFAETLAEAGYAAFSFNFRGYPPSGGERAIAKIDMDLEGAVDYLEAQGVERVALVGASMGGTAAVKVAARRSVAGVIAISAPLEIQGLSAEGDAALASGAKYFMAAEDDVEARLAAAAMYDAAVSPRALEIFVGAEHGTDLVYGARWELVQTRILEFLELYVQ